MKSIYFKEKEKKKELLLTIFSHIYFLKLERFESAIGPAEVGRRPDHARDKEGLQGRRQRRRQDRLGRQRRQQPAGKVEQEVTLNKTNFFFGRVSFTFFFSSSAVLLNCHLDTVPGSPGASDDAVGCAVLLGVLRALTEDQRGRRRSKKEEICDLCF